MTSNRRQQIIVNRMTLIEIVVVLGIMAAVASVVLGSLIESAENDRFDNTYKNGTAIRDAVCGTKETDGISRFLSDMGRLPKVVNTGDGKVLGELFDSDLIATNNKWGRKTLATASLVSTIQAEAGTTVTLSFPSEFSTVSLYCGWRGPYIETRSSKLYDSWLNEWKVLDENGNEVDIASAPTIHGIKSYGSDGAATAAGATDVEWSEKDQTFEFDCPTSSLVVTLMTKEESGNTTTNRSLKEEDTEYNGYLTSLASTGWNGGHPYTAGTKILVNGFVYECTIGGTSATAENEPSWPTKYGSIITDGTGTLTWKCISPRPTLMNYWRIVFFAPSPGDGDDISTSYRTQGHLEANAQFNQITFNDLVPGHRKLYAWGFYYNSTNSVTANKYGSDVIDIKLKPGSNHITLYLVNEL